MAVTSRLAKELLRAHPERAAAVLERLGPDEAGRILRHTRPGEAAEVIRRLSPAMSAATLSALPAEQVADILEALPIGVASRLSRRFAPEHLDAALARVSPQVAGGIRSMVRFPEFSAGALMDPSVMSLREDLTAREAIDRVRRSPKEARYNVYIVDEDQKLVGVANLRELFCARPGARLGDLMVRAPQALDAGADRSVVVNHPGWKEVHSLPVVDEAGCYLGAIRYRTLRELEEELTRGRGEDDNVQEALGQLFSAAAGGLLDALTGSGSEAGGRS